MIEINKYALSQEENSSVDNFKSRSLVLSRRYEKNSKGPHLLDCNGFGQVSWTINVAALQDGNVVG